MLLASRPKLPMVSTVADCTRKSASASLTGDPEVDALLALYVRRTPLGAA